MEEEEDVVEDVEEKDEAEAHQADDIVALTTHPFTYGTPNSSPADGWMEMHQCGSCLYLVGDDVDYRDRL